MPAHDIIDNRQEKLVDHINRILDSSDGARFAVGYFFLSGLTAILEKLSRIKELRLLIGNTTNRETLEQLAEGYHRLEMVADAAEAERYPKRSDIKQMSMETTYSIRTDMELMDQTDEGEALVTSLVQMIEEKRLKVRIYTRGRLHAKAYIFDYGTVYDRNGKPVDRHEEGIAVVGSSNLTLAGITHNTELNVIVQGNDNHAELVRWFEDLWKEAQEFDETLMQEMKVSWAMATVRPYDIYMKTLYALVKDRIMVAGKHQFFPKRELETIEYSIEETYQGLYHELRGYLGKASRKGQPVKPPPNELTYARYGLWHYVVKEKQKKEPYASLHRAGSNLRGLIRVLLFKRFESSVYAFQETVRRLLTVHKRFLEALSQGFIPAGEDAQAILYEPNQDEEQDLMDALRHVSGKYNVADFDLPRLKEHIAHDIRLLEKMLKLIEPITPDQDAKLQTLIKKLTEKPLRDGKRLIFTQYADTARYLFENLNPQGARQDIDVIFSGDKSKVRVVGRFAPKANPEYRFTAGEKELMMVVATDVLAEGLNLQDCDKIINYDLHWNPVRLIQRFGRIDRIGMEHDVVYGFNGYQRSGRNHAAIAPRQSCGI